MRATCCLWSGPSRPPDRQDRLRAVNESLSASGLTDGFDCRAADVQGTRGFSGGVASQERTALRAVRRQVAFAPTFVQRCPPERGRPALDLAAPTRAGLGGFEFVPWKAELSQPGLRPAAARSGHRDEPRHLAALVRQFLISLVQSNAGLGDFDRLEQLQTDTLREIRVRGSQAGTTCRAERCTNGMRFTDAGGYGNAIS